MLLTANMHESFFTCCSFPGAAISKCHRSGGLNNTKVLSPSSGGWKPEIKVLAGLVSEGLREDVFPASALAPGGCWPSLVVLGV